MTYQKNENVHVYLMFMQISQISAQQRTQRVSVCGSHFVPIRHSSPALFRHTSLYRYIFTYAPRARNIRSRKCNSSLYTCNSQSVINVIMLQPMNNCSSHVSKHAKDGHQCEYIYIQVRRWVECIPEYIILYSTDQPRVGENTLGGGNGLETVLRFMTFSSDFYTSDYFFKSHLDGDACAQPTT